MQRFSVTVQGPGWEDLQDMELPRAPAEGDSIETRDGTCLVTKVDPEPDGENYSAKITCRLPG